MSKEEFYELGLEGMEDSAKKREKIARHFHLGKCNAKTLYRRMNLMDISYEEAKEVLGKQKSVGKTKRAPKAKVEEAPVVEEAAAVVEEAVATEETVNA